MTIIGKEWQIPIFTEEEGMRRWKKIRELMAAREIDCLIFAGHTGDCRAAFADVRYVTNYIDWSGDEYLVFPHEGEPTLYVWALQHQYWAEKVSWVKDIIAPPRADTGSRYTGAIVEKMKALGLENKTLGIVSMITMPASVCLGLMKELPQANFIDAWEILRECCIIHSPAELECVRKAGECADKGFQAMVEVAKPGITEHDLIAACEYAMTRNGAEVGSFSLFNTKQWPDGWGFPLSGTYRKLQKGDVILNEFTPSYGGYAVQLCRPISLGKPSADFMEWFEIQKEMYRIAREGFWAGNILSEVDAKVSEYALSKKPFTSARAAFQLMGSRFTNLHPGFSGELKPGMVFQIHPWVNPPEADMRAKKGHMGHIVGDTCIVTEGEPECVSKLPLEVTIV